jgi:hypothetical protein
MKARITSRRFARKRQSPAEEARMRDLYNNFTSVFDYCWACGRGDTFADRPTNWWSWWGIERAHIVSHPRMEMREVIAALCSLCHRHSHRLRIVTGGHPADYPVLERPHLLWLKQKFDPQYFDLSVLQKYAIGRLPEPSQPPQVYLDEYEQRRGRLVA